MKEGKTTNVLVSQENRTVKWIQFALILGVVGGCCFWLLNDSMINQEEYFAKPEREIGTDFRKRRERFVRERSSITFHADGKTNLMQIKSRYHLSNHQVQKLIQQAGITSKYTPEDTNYMDKVGKLVPEKGKRLKILYHAAGDEE